MSWVVALRGLRLILLLLRAETHFGLDGRSVEGRRRLDRHADADLGVHDECLRGRSELNRLLHLNLLVQDGVLVKDGWTTDSLTLAAAVEHREVLVSAGGG